MAPSAVARTLTAESHFPGGSGGRGLHAGKQMQEGPLLQEETKPGFQFSGEPPVLWALPEETACQVSISPL